MKTQLPDEAARRDAMHRAFRDRFGAAPETGARAPGRVDLMGSHTDYNEGWVLTLPIDRDTWILARPRDDDRIRVHALNLDEMATFPAAPEPEAKTEGWALYVQGVTAVLAEAGHAVRGFDAVIHGTVPLGSGLSSSASLEAATATLCEALGGFTLDLVEKAKLCRRAENVWVGMNCGILDQYSSILGEAGQALVLDCRSLTHTYAAFPDALRIVICNTCAPRRLTGSEYGERRAQCEAAAAFFAERNPSVRALRDVAPDVFAAHAGGLDPVAAKRARFVIEENARVTALAEALRRDDRTALGALCAASYAGARDLFEIAVPAMEAMVEAMRAAPGCIGCRQAGAGFGGCMVACVRADAVPAFCEAAAREYRARSGLDGEFYPIAIAPGAGPLAV
jgi:galactokinase